MNSIVSCCFFLVGILAVQYPQVSLSQNTNDFFICWRMQTLSQSLSLQGYFQFPFIRTSVFQTVAASIADINYLYVQHSFELIPVESNTSLKWLVVTDVMGSYDQALWNVMVVNSNAVTIEQFGFGYFIPTTSSVMQMSVSMSFSARTNACVAASSLHGSQPKTITSFSNFRGGNYTKLIYLKIDTPFFYSTSNSTYLQMKLSFMSAPGGGINSIAMQVFTMCQNSKSMTDGLQGLTYTQPITLSGVDATVPQVLYIPKLFILPDDFIPIVMAYGMDLRKSSSNTLIIKTNYTINYNSTHMKLDYYANNIASYALVIGGKYSCPPTYNLFNLTNCFCDSDYDYYFIPSISNTSCMLICNKTLQFYEPLTKTCQKCDNSLNLYYLTNVSNDSCTLVCNQTLQFYEPKSKTCQVCNTKNYLYFLPNISNVSCTLVCNLTSLLMVTMYINTTANTCQWCDFICPVCNATTCFKCGGNMTLTNGSCHCFPPYFADGNQCIDCGLYWGPGCLQCDGAQCYICDLGYSLDLNSYNQCVLCSQYGPQCAECLELVCLNCSGNFIYNATLKMCSCPTIAVNGTCTTCALAFNNQCTSCNSSSCLVCSLNYTVITGSCLCQSGKFNSNGYCLSCLAAYGVSCVSCNATSCLACSLSYSVSAGVCACVGIILANGSCSAACSTIFGVECVTCNPTSCLACSHSYSVSAGQCVCASPMIINSSGVCVSCSTMFGSNCIVCLLSGCTQCSNGYAVSGGTCVCGTAVVMSQCVACSLPFGLNCILCNDTNCQSCLNGLQLISNSGCVDCTLLFNSNCVSCSNSSCTFCSNNFSINTTSGACQCLRRVDFSGICQLCIFFYPYCSTCNSLACLTCFPTFVLLNFTCTCNSTSTLINGSCLPCSLYGVECQNCNQSICLACLNGYNSSGAGCVCFGVVISSACQACTALYGANCLACAASSCSACSLGFSVVGGSCVCLNGSTVAQDGSCLACSSVLISCTQCSSTSNCTSCLSNYLLTGGGCVCSGSVLLFAGICQQCSAIYTHCGSCTVNGCSSCLDNFTLFGGDCKCPYPLVNGSCLTCEQIYGNCSLFINAQYWQIGNKIFFNLSFTKSDITMSLPLQKNLVVTQGNAGITVDYDQSNGIWSYYLVNDSPQSTVEITFPAYIKWNNVSLSNQPTPFSVTYINVAFPQLLFLLFQFIKYCYFLLLLLSLGTLNGLYETFILLSYQIYLSYDFRDSVGVVLEQIHAANLFQLFPGLSISPYTPASPSIQYILLNTNKGYLELNVQVLLCYVLSILLALYVRRYIQRKQGSLRHFAFRNYLHHHSQYVLENTNALAPALCLSIALLIYSLMVMGIQMPLSSSSFLNYSLAVSYLILIALVNAMVFNLYPFGGKYSVVYQGVASNCLGAIQHVLSISRRMGIPLLIVLLPPTPYKHYLLISVNLAYLFILVVNFISAASKADHTVRMLKLVVYIAVQIIMELPMHFFLDMDMIAAYLITSVGIIQTLECLYKLGRLVLRNKREKLIYIPEENTDSSGNLQSRGNWEQSCIEPSINRKSRINLLKGKLDEYLRRHQK